jgi:hypothetical protein
MGAMYVCYVELCARGYACGYVWWVGAFVCVDPFVNSWVILLLILVPWQEMLRSMEITKRLVKPANDVWEYKSNPSWNYDDE